MGKNPRFIFILWGTAPVPHILCQINHTHLHEHNHSFSLSLCLFACLTSLFWHSLHVQKDRLTKLCILWNVAHASSICRDMSEYVPFVDKGWRRHNVPQCWEKPVWMQNGILAVTGRECVIVAFSFSRALWSMVSSNLYSLLHIISYHNQQPLVYYTVFNMHHRGRAADKDFSEL